MSASSARYIGSGSIAHAYLKPTKLSADVGRLAGAHGLTGVGLSTNGLGSLMAKSATFTGVGLLTSGVSTGSRAVHSPGDLVDDVIATVRQLQSDGATPENWRRTGSGFWVPVSPDEYWAVLVTTLFVLVFIATYLSEDIRIGKTFADTNRVSFASEILGLVAAAKGVDLGTRKVYRKITGSDVRPKDDES